MDDTAGQAAGQAAQSNPGYWEWPSSHPAVRTCWRVLIDTDGAWTTGGAEYWALAFTRTPDGSQLAQLAGPTLRPRTMQVRAGESAWGVDLQPHAFWRGLAKATILDELRDLTTECVGGQWWYELGGVRLSVPEAAELDDAVSTLINAGLLAEEPLVAQVLRDGASSDSDPRVEGVANRTLRRRFHAATGLRRGQVEQIRRARAAYALLQAGMPSAEAAATAGFTDQSHLTREMRRLAGRTPAQLLHAEGFSMS